MLPPALPSRSKSSPAEFQNRCPLREDALTDAQQVFEQEPTHKEPASTLTMPSCSSGRRVGSSMQHASYGRRTGTTPLSSKPRSSPSSAASTSTCFTRPAWTAPNSSPTLTSISVARTRICIASRSVISSSSSGGEPLENLLPTGRRWGGTGRHHAPVRDRRSPVHSRPSLDRSRVYLHPRVGSLQPNPPHRWPHPTRCRISRY